MGYKIVRIHTKETTGTQDLASSTTSSTLCRTPYLNNKQHKNTNPITNKQDYQLTQPCPSKEKQTNKSSAQISPYKKITKTTGPTLKWKWKWSRSVMSDSYQAPSSMGFSRQEYWSGLPFPSPGVLPNPRIKTGSPALQADSLSTELWRKPLKCVGWATLWMAVPFIKWGRLGVGRRIHESVMNTQVWDAYLIFK